MIRKAVIIVLSLLAIGSAAVWGISYCASFWKLKHLGEHHAISTWRNGWWLYVETEERPFRKVSFRISPENVSVRYERKVNPPQKEGKAKHQLGPFELELGIRRPIIHCGVGLDQLDRDQIERVTFPEKFVTIRLPAWAPVILFSVYPLIAFVRGPLRRRRRRRQGFCLKCGYDLTGNVSGVCPECGRKIKRP